MADEFDPDAFLKEHASAPSGFDPDAFLKEHATPELTGVRSAANGVANAIKGMGEEAVRSTQEAAQGVGENLSGAFSHPQPKPGEGFWSGYARDVAETPGKAWQAVKGIAGAAGLPLAPAYGAAKSLIGREVMAPLIHKAGEYINPEVAAKQNPEDIYQDVREDVGTALGTVAPGSMKSAKIPVPSAAEAKIAAKAGYKHPDVAAVQIKPQAVSNLAAQIEADLISQGFRPATNNASGTFAEIQRMTPARGTTRVLVDDIDAMRRALGKYAKQVDAIGQPTTEAAAAKAAIDHINRFLPNLRQSDLLAGNANRANSLLNAARRDYASYKRVSLVDTLEENANKQAASTYGGGNVNNAIRQAFRPFGKNNFGRLPGWSNESKEALDRVVSGGPSYSPGNIARQLGRLSPSGPVGVGLHVGSAVASGGYTVPIAVATYAAKKLGIAATRSNVQKLREILAKESNLYRSRTPGPPVPSTMAKAIPLGWDQYQGGQVNPYAP